MGQAIKRYARDFYVLVAVAAFGLTVAGYIVFHQAQHLQVPFISTAPFRIEAAFANARGVLPGQGQQVRIAGVPVGLISGDKLENGYAVVTFNLDPKYSHYIHSDASAFLRPQTGVKDMFVELDPGSQSAPTMKAGGMIGIQNTAPDVNADEVLSALDTDTRAYLQLLVNGLGKGLAGRGDDLRQIFVRYLPLHRDVARITTAIAQRRVALAHLVHNYGQLMNELGDNGGQLTQLVGASNQVLDAFASQNQNISSAVSKLPATLNQTSATLQKVNTYGHVLRPALDALDPPFRQLDTTNRQVLPTAVQGTPLLANEIRPFVRVARPYVRNLRPAAVGLARATPDFTATFHELDRFFNMGAYNKKGPQPVTGNAAQDAQRDEGYLFWLAWAAQDGDSVFSTSDAQGVFRRVELLQTCTSYRNEAELDPVITQLKGVQNLLNDPSLCNQPAP